MKNNRTDYLLIDYNQLLYLALFAIRKNEDEDEILEWINEEFPKRRMKSDVFENQFRNFFWNMIIGVVSKFDTVKQVIICHDNKSWRKKVFPYYKAKRSETKRTDNFDWEYFFELANDFQTNEIEKYSPFIPINCRDCEGDDVIGTLSVALAQEYPKSEVIIYSTDKDFVQLLKYPNIKVYSPTKKKYVNSANPKNDLLQLILMGDRVDGIPNVFNKDDAYVNPEIDQMTGKIKKLRGLGEVTARKAIVENKVYQSIIKTPEIQKNFDRNKLLIDLEMIPVDIQRKIKEEYKKQIEVCKSKSPAELQRYFAREGLGQVASSLSKILHLF